MATKRTRTGKKVKSLRTKGLTGKKAKGVKGGSFSHGILTVRQADGSVTQLADGSVLKQ